MVLKKITPYFFTENNFYQKKNPKKSWCKKLRLLNLHICVLYVFSYFHDLVIDVDAITARWRVVT